MRPKWSTARYKPPEQYVADLHGDQRIRGQLVRQRYAESNLSVVRPSLRIHFCLLQTKNPFKNRILSLGGNSPPLWEPLF